MLYSCIRMLSPEEAKCNFHPVTEESIPKQESWQNL